MIAKRALVAAAIGVCLFVAIASAQWSTVTRATYVDGGVLRDHLILGRFKYQSTTEDPRIQASAEALTKLEEYGFRFSTSKEGCVVKEGAQREYTLQEERQGDLKQEAAKLAREKPWLKVAWHGKLATAFYARGTDPKLCGFVEVNCLRLPEAKHGPGMIHIVVSVHE